MVEHRASPTLAELRRNQGLTQRQIGDGIGVTDKAVGEWERGVHQPRLTPFQMLRMMELYGCKTLQELAMAVAASIERSKD